ncbi:MAG: DNA/RNA non-specific endonuclease [Treponema sp.]|nr:DNA/RNA non-specific endonuclease [Treponema sp.]
MANKKKNNSKKVISTIVTILIIIAAVAWFVGGKPYIEIGAEGVTLVQTEEPLAKHIPEIIRGEYPPEEEYVIVEAENSSAAPDRTADPGRTVVPEALEGQQSKGGNGTSGSNPSADQGHAENDPLFFGNPTDSFADTSLTVNYLMVKPQYTLSYNASTYCPNWVAWHLGTENMGSADRMDDFRPDPELPEGWYGIKKADYQYNKYGFDRGHVCPSADRTTTKDDNSMTFLMTNMVPQSPDNNRVIWMHFENYERELAKAGNELYIIAGPYGTGGTSSKGTFDEIPVTLKSGEVLHMNVPAYTWKVVLAIPAGEGDFSRVDEGATAIAINVPNKMGMQKTGDWEQFICSIDEIEALTGYDFFELLPDDIEDKLEAMVYER